MCGKIREEKGQHRRELSWARVAPSDVISSDDDMSDDDDAAVEE